MTPKAHSVTSEPWAVRPSVTRWRALRSLLIALERLVQANTVIDLRTTRRSARLAQAVMFERELAEVEHAIDDEITRLTVEGLQATLDVAQRGAQGEAGRSLTCKKESRR